MEAGFLLFLSYHKRCGGHMFVFGSTVFKENVVTSGFLQDVVLKPTLETSISQMARKEKTQWSEGKSREVGQFLDLAEKLQKQLSAFYVEKENPLKSIVERLKNETTREGVGSLQLYLEKNVTNGRADYKYLTKDVKKDEKYYVFVLSPPLGFGTDPAQKSTVPAQEIVFKFDHGEPKIVCYNMPQGEHKVK